MDQQDLMVGMAEPAELVELAAQEITVVPAVPVVQEITVLLAEPAVQVMLVELALREA